MFLGDGGADPGEDLQGLVVAKLPRERPRQRVHEHAPLRRTGAPGCNDERRSIERVIRRANSHQISDSGTDTN